MRPRFHGTDWEPGRLTFERLQNRLAQRGAGAARAAVDVARDASGRWRHPARWHRARADLQTADLPRLPSPTR